MKITADQREAWSRNTKDSPINRWIGPLVAGEDGALDLEKLHAIARRYGVDPTAYAHLNPGQQRMNIGNRLRSIVPTHVYEGEGAEGEPGILLSPQQPETAPFPEIHAATVRTLLQMHGAIMDTLRERGILRTGNAPLGDYAEYLFSLAFGWTLEANSAAGHDAVDGQGGRYQIKARRVLNPKSSKHQLGAIRRLPEQPFDFLAAALFDAGYGVLKAVLVPHKLVLERATYVPHVNGWRLMLDEKLWSNPTVIDVTVPLRRAAESDEG